MTSAGSPGSPRIVGVLQVRRIDRGAEGAESNDSVEHSESPGLRLNLAWASICENPVVGGAPASSEKPRQRRRECTARAVGYLIVERHEPRD